MTSVPGCVLSIGMMVHVSKTPLLDAGGDIVELSVTAAVAASVVTGVAQLASP